jgi:hypothetical protein
MYLVLRNVSGTMLDRHWPVFFYFFVELGFELRVSLLQSRLESHLQSILLWLFWRWCLPNYLPRLASNHDHPNLSLPVARITNYYYIK